MVLADAQGLVTALMALGYSAWATATGNGQWQVQVTAPGAIDQATVNGFAAQHNSKVTAYNVATAVTFG